MSTAAVIDMTPKHVPADVPVRHMAFNFDAGRADDRFYLQAELASAYFEALSIFLTYGEDLVIDTARHGLVNVGLLFLQRFYQGRQSVQFALLLVTEFAARFRRFGCFRS